MTALLVVLTFMVEYEVVVAVCDSRATRESLANNNSSSFWFYETLCKRQLYSRGVASVQLAPSQYLIETSGKRGKCSSG